MFSDPGIQTDCNVMFQKRGRKGTLKQAGRKEGGEEGRRGKKEGGRERRKVAHLD